MLEVTIDGVKTQVPQCTCGKCIIRRLHKDFFESIPYKDLSTTYTRDYPWKTKVKFPGYYNRSKHSNFETSYKEFLPNGLTSEMKANYVPHKINYDQFKKEPTEIYSIPFMGRTNYDFSYPNWGTITLGGKYEDKLPDIQIPIRGDSNYRENYVRHPDKFYSTREPLNFAKSTMKFYGNLHPETTYDASYKPFDPNRTQYKFENPNKKSYAFLVPDLPSDCLPTEYRAKYIKFEDKMCKLRKYLNARGMRYLII